jgi:ATP-dependent helicase/nuclease subunit A
MSAAERRLVDDAARERAGSDLATSFCVEAGAGTGKTSLLVDRFLSIVASGRATCGQIVAITFTEKAAGEMKVRLRQRIMERLREGQLAESARRNLETAHNELERAPISTIHSFAATILREHPIEARVDPNFTQLDGTEGALFFDECWDDFLLGMADDWSAVLRRFISLGGSIENLRSIAEMLYQHRGERCCEHVFSGGDPSGGARIGPSSRAAARRTSSSSTGPADSNGERATLGDLRGAFADASRRLSALARDHCMEPEDLGLRSIEDFAEAMGALDVLRGDDLDYFLLTFPIPNGTKGNRGNWRPPEACAEQKAVFKELGTLQGDARKRISDDVREGIAGFAEALLDFVDERKAHEGVLDFDDLLIKVRMLCADQATLDALRERYRFILVDEFQDTDPVQAEIIYLLAGAAGRPGAAEPEPGKLFIVGDPKQSIYRFRKADVEIYERVKERLVSSGARLAITQNFRSVPGIVDWVNGAFSAIMQPPAAGAYQPAYEEIHAFRTGMGPAVVLLDLELAAEESRADDVRRREGEAVARFVHRLLESGMTVTDPVTKQRRDLAHGDIAVIYPGTTGIDYYEEPLRAEGIPYIVEGGKLYYAREEVRDLAAAVWAIEDPYDTLALVGVLRSPMFGVSDEELFLFTRASGRLNYLDPGAGALGEFTDLAAAFKLLAELHARRNERGPSGTLLELLRRTKYTELSLLRPHGDQRVSNIGKAVASARRFEGAIHSFRRFARWFRDQETFAAAEGESPVVEEQAQAVRLLTVHKAKGLQFPVVILANLVQSKRRSSRILVEGGRSPAFKLGFLETSDFAELLERERSREEAETVRLLYVAATRAGDLLVIPKSPDAGTYFGLIAPHLVQMERLETHARGDGKRALEAEGDRPTVWTLSALPPLRGAARPFVRFDGVKARDARRAAEARKAWIRERTALLEAAGRAPLSIAPSKLGAAGVLSRGDAEEQEARRAPGLARRDRALRFGEALHRIMEWADASGGHSLGALAGSVAAELGIGDAAQELERLALRALESDLMQRAAKARRAYREVPFTLPVTGTLIEGRIDLLFEEDGTWTLVDYKTDEELPATDADIDAYRLQAGLYAVALKRFGIECRGGIALYFARHDVAKMVDYSPDLLSEAEQLIDESISRSGAD